MAHILELSDGSTTVDFLDSSGTSWCLLVDGGLTIEKPRIREKWTGGGIPSIGQQLVDVSYDNRRISIEFEIAGDDRDDIVNMATSIVRLISQAHRSQITPQAVPPVYLKYQIDTLTSPVYFDVLSGNLELPQNIMSLEALTWSKGSQDTIKGFVLELLCKPLARGAEVTLVDGTLIDNTSDGNHTNYVAITGTSVNGDVPGPTRIKFGYDTGADSIDRRHVYIGVKDYGTFLNYISVLEAEDGVFSLYGGSSVGPSVNYSGDDAGSGGYAVEWTITQSTVKTLMYWELSDSYAQDNKGKVRAIAVGSFDIDCQYRISYFFGGTTLLHGDWYRPPADYDATNNYMFDLGVIDLFPIEARYGEELDGSTFWFQCLPDDATSMDIRLDAIILIPAEQYKYRYYRAPFSSLSTITEDYGYTDTVRLRLPSGDTLYRSVEHAGFPIYLEPNTDARMYMFIGENITTSLYRYVPDRITAIWVYHTPLYYNIRGSE